MAASYCACNAMAWTDHGLDTRQALGVATVVAAAQPMKVESLESFVFAERQGLARLLDAEETWARSHIEKYPPRSASLDFKPPFTPDDTPGESRKRFLSALRINPEAKLTLFLQAMPGAVSRGPSMPWTEVTTLRRETIVSQLAFIALREGETVSAIDVLSTASDEPDYGLDIGLWEENETAWGKVYGFGHQPFGNPRLEISTQAPFHMGFYHEASVLYMLAGFLKRTWPEYRIHLYRSLSTYAFKTGHPYWGWRFAGWGLHYVEDLTQPYHASALPGMSLTKIIWANTIDKLGVHGPKTDAIQLVTNRHLALENYQYHRVKLAYERGQLNDPLVAALRDRASDARYPAWSDSSPREVVTRESADAAVATDALLERTLPAHYVSDPKFVFSEADGTTPDVFAVMQKEDAAKNLELERGLLPLMQHLGSHSRSFIESLVPDASGKVPTVGASR